MLKEILDTIKIIFNPPKQKGVTSKPLALNAFFNTPNSGNIFEQCLEVKNILGIKTVRVNFQWNDGTHPSPNSKINWGFSDEIIKSLEAVGMECIIVIGNTPSWLEKQGMSQDEMIEYAFQQFVIPLVDRYKNSKAVIGFQIWNEVNSAMFHDNWILGFTRDHTKYVKFLKQCSQYIRKVSKKLVLNAATTSIIQSYPYALKYNKKLVEAGILDDIDIFCVHVYGESWWQFVRPGGVFAFLKGIQKPIWITETGVGKMNEQKSYFLRMIPFLLERVPTIQKVFWYMHRSASMNHAFGLITEGQKSSLYELIEKGYSGLKNPRIK